jgi:hypothetical protein
MNQKIKVYEILFGKASKGWICDIAVSFYTHRQFTRETHIVRGYGKLGVFGFTVSYVRAKRNIRKLRRKLQSLPGKHNWDGVYIGDFTI